MPRPPRAAPTSPTARGPKPFRLKRIATLAHQLHRITTQWGPSPVVLGAGLAFLDQLFGSALLGDCRIPVSVSATDLHTGRRVVMTSGPAAECVYASSALAGVVPPLEHGDGQLADGAYSDVAPVDVARSYGFSRVLAVDPGQLHCGVRVRNGLEAMMRASEVCYTRHAALRFREADLVIRPAFTRTIETLDFAAKRDSVAAGIRGVRRARAQLEQMLGRGRVPRGRAPAEP